jgi:hypothetical protein
MTNIIEHASINSEKALTNHNKRSAARTALPQGECRCRVVNPQSQAYGGLPIGRPPELKDRKRLFSFSSTHAIPGINSKTANNPAHPWTLTAPAFVAGPNLKTFLNQEPHDRQ